MGSNWFLRQRCDRFFTWIRKLVAIPRRRAGFSLRCGQRALIQILHEVFREKDIQRPIDRHTHFLFHARQFAPVNTAPEKPCEKSGKIHAKDPCHTSAPTDRCELSKRFECEWFLRFAIDTCDDVMRENFTFARRVLRSRRTIVTGGGIWDQRAIAQRPKTVVALDLEIRISFAPTPFLGTHDKIQDWV